MEIASWSRLQDNRRIVWLHSLQKSACTRWLFAHITGLVQAIHYQALPPQHAQYFCLWHGCWLTDDNSEVLSIPPKEMTKAIILQLDWAYSQQVAHKITFFSIDALVQSKAHGLTVWNMPLFFGIHRMSMRKDPKLYKGLLISLIAEFDDEAS